MYSNVRTMVIKENLIKDNCVCKENGVYHNITDVQADHFREN